MRIPTPIILIAVALALPANSFMSRETKAAGVAAPYSIAAQPYSEPAFAAAPVTEKPLTQRIGITGVGIIPARCGFTLAEAWNAARKKHVGYGPITQFDASTFDCRIAFEAHPDFDRYFAEHTRIRPRERRLLSRSAQLAIAASMDAITSTGQTRFDPFTPVYGGVASNAVADIETQLRAAPHVIDRKAQSIPRETLLKTYFSLPASAVAQALGFRGETKVESTACASTLSALNSARLAVVSGYARSVLVFGSDAPVNAMTWNAFESAGLLTSGDSVPILDRATTLTALGESAAAFYIESLHTARARGLRSGPRLNPLRRRSKTPDTCTSPTKLDNPGKKPFGAHSDLILK